MPKERIDWLDVARGGSILLVVCLHATMYLEAAGLASYGYTLVNKLFEPIRMPVFFTVSGILAARAIRAGWAEMLGRKIWVFAYLFGLWTLIRWLYYHFVQVNVVTPAEGSSLAELLTSWVAPSSGLWFIWALGLYFLAAKALLPVQRLGLALAIVLSVAAFGGLIQPENFAQRNVLLYAPFFLGGAWQGGLLVQAVSRAPWRCVLLGLAGFVGLMLAQRALPAALLGPLLLGLSLFGVLLGAAAAVLLARVGPLKRGFSYLGQNTLPIYVAHVLIVSALSAVMAAALAGLPLVRFWSVPALVAVTIPLSLGLRVVAERAGAGWLYRPPAPEALPLRVGLR